MGMEILKIVKRFVNKLTNLIDVKSIITITMTICFVGLTFAGSITGADFITIFLVIITYYFSKKEDATATKSNSEDE
jgi:hypothetical protein